LVLTALTIKEDEPVSVSGTATRSGEPLVPTPIRVESCATEKSDPAADVVCSVPSGNLMPPLRDSIMPATESLDVGVSVPMPTFPYLSSKMVVSPMTELLLVKPAHFVSLPNVPLPVTGKLAPVAAAGAMLKNGPDAFADPLEAGREPDRASAVWRPLPRATRARKSDNRNSVPAGVTFALPAPALGSWARAYPETETDNIANNRQVVFKLILIFITMLLIQFKRPDQVRSVR
jgi:hypothetical protein